MMNSENFKKTLRTIFVYCFFFVPFFADAGPYLQVNLHSYPCGMFSVFSYVAGVLYQYDQGEHDGIEVDFENFGLYYDPSVGENWWEYYCEPIRMGIKDSKEIKNFTVGEYVERAYFVERELSRLQVSHLIQKYIKIKLHVQNKIDGFLRDHFINTPVIGVHYRGTDKATESPRVSYKKVFSTLLKYVKSQGLTKYKLFVATDEREFVEFMKKRFPGRVLTYSTEYSANAHPIHIGRIENQYLIGEQALIDCILLSKCQFLIRTSSNLSLWSTYFNPFLPFILVQEKS